MNWNSFANSFLKWNTIKYEYIILNLITVQTIVMLLLKNVERFVKFFRMTAAQHLDICARHLNKILSAIKKHFRGTHKNCARPHQTHISIQALFEQSSLHINISSTRLASAAGAHHQLHIRSHYIKIIVGRTGSVKFKPKNTLHLALIIL